MFALVSPFIVYQNQSELENVICFNEIIYSCATLNCVSQANKALFMNLLASGFTFFASRAPGGRKNEAFPA